MRATPNSSENGESSDDFKQTKIIKYQHISALSIKLTFFSPLLDTLTFDQHMLFFQNFGMDFHI